MGPALIVQWDFPEVPDRAVGPDQVEAEVARLHSAVDDVVATLTELGERVLRRAGPEEARIFDAQILMAQDGEFLKGVEVLIRKNQLSAETAYEFKALELRNLWSRRGQAARAARRPPCHSAADHQPAPRPLRCRALGVADGRSGDRRRPRALARPHRAARPRARRWSRERGRHEDGARRHSRPQPRHPRGDGRRGRTGQHPVRHDDPARRTERGHRPRSHRGRAGGRQDAGEPAPQARAAARGRGGPARGHARRAADPHHGERGPAGGDRARAPTRRAGRRPPAHRVPAHRAGDPADRGRAGRTTSAASRWPFPTARSSSARSTWAATSSRSPSRPRTRPIPSSAGGPSVSVSTSRRCSGLRSGRCFGPPGVATCSSCCRWSRGSRRCWRRGRSCRRRRPRSRRPACGRRRHSPSGS